MTAVDDLRRSITAQLAQLEAEAAALREALRVLERAPGASEGKPAASEEAPGAAEGAPGASGSATAVASERREPRRPRRSEAVVVPAEKLASLLREGGGEGASTGDLTQQTGGDRDQILALLRELEQAGQVRRSGERRTTRWYAITDEDRIAERVAELEARQGGVSPAAEDLAAGDHSSDASSNAGTAGADPAPAG